MGYNLTNEFIDDSFQQLTQISGSALLSGTGSRIQNLNLTASNAISASHAISSSHTEFSDNATSASYSVSSSHSANSDNAISSSYALSSSHAEIADNSTSSSYAVSASHAVTASYALNSIPQLSASYAVTASWPLRGFTDVASNGLQFTFTRGNGTTEQISATITGSVENAVSASHAIQADSASTAVSASHALASNTSISASHALNSDNSISSSYAVSASQADNAISSSYSVSSSHAVNADVAISSSWANFAGHSNTTQEVVINVKNTSGGTIAKGTPVYATGVTGENINISPADNASSATMPAIAVTQVSLTNNAVGEAVVSGKIVGVNTGTFTPGKNIYVDTSGGFTQTKPTGTSLIQNIGVVGKVDGTDGEIVIQGSGRSNDLPNIPKGQAWIGDASGVPQAVNTSSLDVATSISSSYALSSSHAIVADSTISASHALLADNLTPGDKNHTGALNSQITAPGNFSQKNFVTVTGASFNGTSYPISEFAYINYEYAGFPQFWDAFNIAQYDGFNYTAGSELLIAPQRVQFNMVSDGTGPNYAGVMAMQSASAGNGTQTLVYGNEVQLGAFRGVTITLGNRSGIATRQTENLAINAVTSSLTTDYNYESANIGHYVTGGTRGNVTTITNAGSGNNSFLSLNGGNFYELDITTSDTILAFNTLDTTDTWAQTFQIKVTNTTNALTFSSNFKFPGGTAPTISANGTDILTGTYYGESNENVYITNLNNFF